MARPPRRWGGARQGSQPTSSGPKGPDAGAGARPGRAASAGAPEDPEDTRAARQDTAGRGRRKRGKAGRARAAAAPSERARPGAAGPAHGPPQRIAKLLARAGHGSRREIERLIAEGRVAVGGTPITTPATRLPDLAGVTVDGRPARAPEPPRLFLFHKPPGVLTTARDPAGRPTLADVLPADLPRLMPVGRLDMTTEGLLLLTNDGALKRRLELPANGFLRTYRVRALGRVSPADLERLAEGIEIDGVRYGPVEASLDRRARAGAANVWLTFRLAEGKNREIRRLCAALGLVVNRLIRVGFGPFALGDLPPRGIVEVPAAEVRRLLAHRP